ncbi:BQ2448_4981 [Microbotryum intermedium]|uniref:BQ2448_4981 protein n=1 Tax=Microbotryum intermedium TaxID=269621 RepID=A0A238FGC3_9BASI|nr:BQ2448_4981 [Microbotryum intermedium]
MAIATPSSPLATTSRSDDASPGSAKSRLNNTRTYGRRGLAAAAAASGTTGLRGSTPASMTTPSYAQSHHNGTAMHLDNSSSSSGGSDTEQDQLIEKQLGLGLSAPTASSRVDKGKGKVQVKQVDTTASSSTVITTLTPKRSISTLRGKEAQGSTASTSSANLVSLSGARVVSRALPSSVPSTRHAPTPSTSASSSSSTPKPELISKLNHKMQDSDDEDDDVQEPPSPPPRRKRPLPLSNPPVLAPTTNKPTSAKATPLSATRPSHGRVPSTQAKTKTSSVSPNKKRKTIETDLKGATPTTTARPSTPPPPPPVPSRTPRSSTPELSRSSTASKVASTSAARVAAITSPLRSPAKDLSGIFDAFNSATASASDSGRSAAPKEVPPKSPSKSPLKESTTSWSVVAGMAPRRRGSSPGLTRQGSLTPTSSRTLNALSPRSLGPSHSQPILSPTRPTSRSGSPSRHPSPSTPNLSIPTLSGVPNRVVPSLIESGAIAPRASGAGVRKTYGGGGGRSFRRDKDEDDLMGLPSALSKEVEEDEASQESMSIISPERTSVIPTATTTARRSYSSMRIEYGVEEEETILLESQQASSLSSITQLIAKGESTKFMDEVAYLLEGLGDADASIGIRRSSAIELVRKVVEEREFSKRIKSLGLEEAVYKALRRCQLETHKEGAGEGRDRCLELCLAVFLGRIARDQRGFEPLMRVTSREVGGEGIKSRRGDGEGANEGDVLGVVRGWLEATWSAEEIGTAAKGVGKAELRSLTGLRNLIINNDLLGAHSSSTPFPTTLGSLAIQLLSTIASFEPRAIFRPQLLVCTSGSLKALVGTMTKGCEALESRLTKYEKGLDLVPLPEQPTTATSTTTKTSARSSLHLPLVALQIGVLETCLSVCPEQALGPLTQTSTSLVTSFSTLILISELVIFGHRGSSSIAPDTDAELVERPEQRAAIACLLGALKLVVQLTIADARWSAELVAVHQGRIVGSLVRVLQSARKGMIVVGEEKRGKEKDESRGDDQEKDGEEQEGDKAMLDLLCLALGTLTNLVESVDHVKTILRETLLSPTCQERRRCTLVCHCDGREPAVSALAKLYIETPPTSNEINTSFLTGYSGLLLGLTMLDSERNEAIVEEALKGHPRARKELQAAMAEFASLHESIEDGSGGAEGEADEEGHEAAGIGSGVGDRDKERGQVAVRIREMLRRMKA